MTGGDETHPDHKSGRNIEIRKIPKKKGPESIDDGTVDRGRREVGAEKKRCDVVNCRQESGLFLIPIDSWALISAVGGSTVEEADSRRSG